MDSHNSNGVECCAMAKKKGSMGAAVAGGQGLVITNLSNLDAYTELTGEEYGWELAQNLSDAIQMNPGPVVVVDSFAPLDGSPASAPRAWLVSRLIEFQDAISWIQYNEESEDPYDEMTQELLHTLNTLGVKRVTLGGIWYGTDEEGECDDPVIEALALFYPIEVLDTIVGCGV